MRHGLSTAHASVLFALHEEGEDFVLLALLQQLITSLFGEGLELSLIHI